MMDAMVDVSRAPMSEMPFDDEPRWHDIAVARSALLDTLADCNRAVEEAGPE